MHGELRLDCERGAIRMDLLLSPAEPPRLQEAGIKEELPPDGIAKAGAKAIAASINTAQGDGNGRDKDSSDVLPLAPSLDQVRTWRMLRRIAVSHTGCVVDRGWMEVSYGVDIIDHSLHYALTCQGGPLEVVFTTDANTGRIASLDVHPPHAPEATCWP